MNTLFLKDSVLFILFNGKEYEVSNPEILAFNLVPPYEWAGDVELIKQRGAIGLTVARLLPKEKKEPVVESSEPQEEMNTVEGWISLELQTPKPMQWVLVWIEERKMSFMACRRAYPDEQSYSMWDSPFDEVTIYNGEIYYWKPMPKFTLTRLTP